MKKYLIPILVVTALTACKTEIEKDISLKTLLNEPIKTEMALLNVEIPSCSNHEDSRKPSDNLIKIQAQIPNVFPNAKYKECFKKRFDSFASFEIPVGVGKIEDNVILENDINIYSYKNRQLNVKTTEKLANNIREFLKKEYINNLEFNILLNLKNDTDQDHEFTLFSSYLDDSPVPSLATPTFKKGESHIIKLANASADSLWMYKTPPFVVVLSSPFNIDEVTQVKQQ